MFSKKLPQDWDITTLGNCADWYSGGTPKTSTPEFWNGSIPWISASSLKEFYITDSERRVTSLGVENGTHLVPKNSILFVVRGMSLKSEFRVGIAQRPVTFGQDCKAIVAHDRINPLFLANVLRAKRKEILSLVDEASHGTGRLQTNALEGIKIPVPPAIEQKAVGGFISSLDNKIELNQQMNQTLEAIARAIFKSWFVDFDPVHAKARGEVPVGMDAETAELFPDTFQDSPLGPIPSGWQTGTISEIITLIGGGTPKTSIPEYWDGDIPWYSVRDAPPNSDVYVIDTEKKITQAGVNNSSTKILPLETTIISARGTVGKLALTANPMAMNQSCYGIRGESGYSQLFTFFNLRSLIELLRQSTHGTVFDTITSKTFTTIKTTIPPQEIVQAYDTQIRPILDKIKNNLEESRTLTDLRDTLLPKLISGQLRLPQFQERSP